jgi:hypothetical protein
VTADPAGDRLPLTALLSQVLVAFTIEFDHADLAGTGVSGPRRGRRAAR